MFGPSVEHLRGVAVRISLRWRTDGEESRVVQLAALVVIVVVASVPLYPAGRQADHLCRLIIIIIIIIIRPISRCFSFAFCWRSGDRLSHFF